MLVEISEWRNGETLNCFLDNSKSAEDFFLYKRILTQLYFILDTLESHKIVHRDIWLGNLIFERSTSKLSLIDTSTACFLKDVAAQNNDKVYANLKHPDDKKSVGRIEDKIYKKAEIMLSSCSHFRFDGSCDLSEELYARLSSLQIPEQVRRRLILSGSSVLAILGIRKNRDIDVFCPRYIEREDLPFELQSHNFQLRYIGLDGFWDLFLDPSAYFEWRGYKVLHPHLLLRLKSRRLCKEFREKDVHDIRSLAKFLDLNIQGFN